MSCDKSCPIEHTVDLIGHKWKVLILRNLMNNGTQRFNELNKGIKGISQKMLTQQLRKMESDGLIRRKVYPEVPPRVEYSLTELGQTLKPILDAMSHWGTEHINSGILDD
ncbi:MAG: helix-turn-helix domain-containing protein [Clostridiaceae bacterium]